jgi:hypothetical protein
MGPKLVINEVGGHGVLETNKNLSRADLAFLISVGMGGKQVVYKEKLPMDQITHPQVKMSPLPAHSQDLLPIAMAVTVLSWVKHQYVQFSLFFCLDLPFQVKWFRERVRSSLGGGL